MALELITGPSVEPLTATEAKTRLGIGSEVSDGVISSLITVARQTIDGRDGWLGRALINQQWRYIVDNFTNDNANRAPLAFELPLAPVVSVDSVGYRDAAGTLTAFTTDQYRIIKGSPTRLLAYVNVFWPSYFYRYGSYEIEFTAGYGTTGASVPEPIRQAICLMVRQALSMATRDQNVMVENVIGVGSTTYATGRDSGADAITAAAQSLLAPFRLIL